MEEGALRNLIEEHLSVRRIAEAAGVSYSTIRYWLKFYGLKSKGKLRGIRRRSLRPPCRNCGTPVNHMQNVYCSPRCQFQFRRRIRIEQNVNAVGKSALKSYLFDQRGHRCEVCGISEWMGRPAPLELDHKDGNSSNNVLDNIRLICPNCHAQTATYKGRNMGQGRHHRRERYAQGKSY
jgi:Zn finger protein HypA/HybF involved in hydrogenase expression